MLCATTQEGAAEKARALGFQRSTADWRELVADPAVDAVVIASPQHTHQEIALAAIGQDKPVLCEKPMGVSLAESLTMADAAESAGIVNMVGFNYMRTPASQFARRLDRGWRDRRHQFFPRRAHGRLLCRPAGSRHLANSRPCQRHDGGSGIAHDQCSTGSRRADRCPVCGCADGPCITAVHRQPPE